MGLIRSGNFSGSNYLSVANYTGNQAAFSVSCWVKTNGTQASRIFFSNYQPSGSKGWAVGISDGVNNQIKFYLGSATLSQSGTFSDRVWHHFVFTHDGTTAKIYVDGNTTPNASTNTAVSYGSVPANNYIGSLEGSSQDFIGCLAGVGYWNKALSTAEVTSLYNSGLGLKGSDLSGTLLTSLGSYHDFYDATNLGTDSSGNARNMTNTGSVTQFLGPDPAGYTSPPGLGVPARRVINPAWATKMLVAIVPGEESGNLVGARDRFSQGLLPFVTSAMTRAVGPWGPELNNTHTGSNGVLMVQATHQLQGSNQFTLSSLCTADAFGDLYHLWSGENNSTADMRFCLSASTGGFAFQLGADGSFPLLGVIMPDFNVYTLVTIRLAPGGVRSIWYGPHKVAERTDAGIAYGSGVETNGSGWGGSPQSGSRAWSGRLTCGYGWNRALSDAEIVALATDPFAPVRPAPPRMGGVFAARQGGAFNNSPYIMAHL